MNSRPHEPPLAPEVARANGLRTGWTTGTCASAAAKAAVLGLVTGSVPETVDVALPGGPRVTFSTSDGQAGDPARAAVVKDAGDDPDVTNGAHVTVTATFWAGGPAGGARLHAGDGVGSVTLPGLGLAVGAPAINPVPERMIRAAVAEVTDRAVDLTISVPGGRAMAAKTSNARLGIVGGISILGTTGIVRPFSTASWRASVVQQVDVAAAQGRDHVILSTGGRTDAAAQRLFADLPPVCFVEVGDFTGIALRRAAATGVGQVTFVGMAGKIAKLAAGVFMTHYRRSKVDVDLLQEVARECGAPDEVVAAATETATARHFAEACMAAGDVTPLAALCRRAAAAGQEFTGGQVAFAVIMVDFDGSEVLARA